MSAFTALPELYVTPEAAQGLRDEAARRLQWVLSPVQMRDLGLLMDGAMFPLRGYLGEADHAAVVAGGRIASGAAWPLALEVSAGFAHDLETGEDIALCAPDGEVLAMMSVTDRWGDDPVRLGGRVKGLVPVPGRDAGLTPNALRARFRAAGCARVVAELGEAVVLHPDAGAPIRLPLAGDAAWQAIAARNHGATHLDTGGDATLRALAAEVGLEPAG